MTHSTNLVFFYPASSTIRRTKYYYYVYARRTHRIMVLYTNAVLYTHTRVVHLQGVV